MKFGSSLELEESIRHLRHCFLVSETRRRGGAKRIEPKESGGECWLDLSWFSCVLLSLHHPAESVHLLVEVWEGHETLIGAAPYHL